MISKERELELKAKLDKGEIDIYDYLDETRNLLEGISWSNVYFEADKADTPTVHKTKKEIEGQPSFFLVKIRISNGRTYLVAKVPIQNQDSMDEEEATLFNHYYKKLNKRHFHIQKPRHRVFRTSIIDEMYIDVSES